MGLPQPTPAGEQEPDGESRGGLSATSPTVHNLYQSSETPHRAVLGLYLILYTTTWLQESSTVKRWLGGNQQLRSSVTRAKSGWHMGSTPGDGNSAVTPQGTGTSSTYGIRSR